MISVIMPVYNGALYIKEAMDSVVCQTTAEDIELYVIDDASTDGTGQVVEAYQKQLRENGTKGAVRSIRYHRNSSNLGAAESRNTGMRLAQGEYLAFLDADDWWSTDKLERQLVQIRKEDTVLVYTGRELMHPDGTTTGKIVSVPEKTGYRELLHTNCIPCSSVLMKTAVAQEFYMCHDELHEDYILWLRVLQKYGTAYGINRPLLKSRLSAGGKSRNKLRSAKMHYGVYRYMGIPWWRAIGLFICYAVNGVKKYR